MIVIISTPVTSDESLARSQGVRVMDIPTEQKPEPERTVEKKRFAQRGIGIFMVIGSGVLGYLSMVAPLQAAARHEDDVSISMKGVVFVPALFAIGLFLIFTGDRPSQILGTREKPSVLAWIVCIGVGGIGILLYEWLKSRLRAYGYDFSR